MNCTVLVRQLPNCALSLISYHLKIFSSFCKKGFEQYRKSKTYLLYWISFLWVTSTKSTKDESHMHSLRFFIVKCQIKLNNITWAYLPITIRELSFATSICSRCCLPTFPSGSKMWLLILSQVLLLRCFFFIFKPFLITFIYSQPQSNFSGKVCSPFCLLKLQKGLQQGIQDSIGYSHWFPAGCHNTSRLLRGKATWSHPHCCQSNLH